VRAGPNELSRLRPQQQARGNPERSHQTPAHGSEQRIYVVPCSRELTFQVLVPLLQGGRAMAEVVPF